MTDIELVELRRIISDLERLYWAVKGGNIAAEIGKSLADLQQTYYGAR